MHQSCARRKSSAAALANRPGLPARIVAGATCRGERGAAPRRGARVGTAIDDGDRPRSPEPVSRGDSSPSPRKPCVHAIRYEGTCRGATKMPVARTRALVAVLMRVPALPGSCGTATTSPELFVVVTTHNFPVPSGRTRSVSVDV